MDVLITESYFTNCSKCKKQITRYYDNRICQSCLVGNRGSFPKGKGCYVPCKICVEPNIKWFYRALYGKIPKGCSQHND